MQSNRGLMTRLVRAESLSCIFPLEALLDVAFPPLGPVGRSAEFTMKPRFPTCSGTLRRYDCPLSLSRSFAGRSFPDPWRASLRWGSPLRARVRVEAPRTHQGLWSPPSGLCGKETDGAPTFPRSPGADRPRSQTVRLSSRRSPTGSPLAAI
jgi:hypothetical protein